MIFLHFCWIAFIARHGQPYRSLQIKSIWASTCVFTSCLSKHSLGVKIRLFDFFQFISVGAFSHVTLEIVSQLWPQNSQLLIGYAVPCFIAGKHDCATNPYFTRWMQISGTLNVQISALYNVSSWSCNKCVANPMYITYVLLMFAIHVIYCRL